MSSARRLLLVHAHPDDESIGTGATMARYAAEGAQVTLVTCTLGELGEIIPPSLAHLADGDGSRLGEYRTGELAAACAELAQRAGDERDPRTLGGVPGHRRPGADRLVIRVRVHQQQPPGGVSRAGGIRDAGGISRTHGREPIGCARCGQNLARC